MRYVAVIVLTLCQFTVYPFLAMVSANSARQQISDTEGATVQVQNLQNVTTVFKTTTM